VAVVAGTISCIELIRGARVAEKLTGLQKFAVGLAALVGALIVVMIVAFGGKEDKRTDRARDAEMTEIKLQRLAREFVTANLKDPDSAKFRNQKGVCGEVNAKNSFGGYAGFVRFIAGGKDLVIMENNPALAPGAFKESWDRFCK